MMTPGAPGKIAPVTSKGHAVVTLETGRYEMEKYDAIYLQWMLALYSLEGDSSLYALAADNAAQVHATARRLRDAGAALVSAAQLRDRWALN